MFVLIKKSYEINRKNVKELRKMQTSEKSKNVIFESKSSYGVSWGFLEGRKRSKKGQKGQKRSKKGKKRRV